MSTNTKHAKQTKETARKGRKLRDLRSKGITWEEASRRVGIVKENGDPDPGLAYRIALEGYEPKGQDVRDRLGLRKICLACNRAIRTVARSARSLSPWRLWWNRLTPGDRDRRIRREYEEEK